MSMAFTVYSASCNIKRIKVINKVQSACMRLCLAYQTTAASTGIATRMRNIIITTGTVTAVVRLEDVAASVQNWLMYHEEECKRMRERPM